MLVRLMIIELRVIDKMIQIVIQIEIDVDLKFSNIDSLDVELRKITSCDTARNTQFVSMFIHHNSRF